MSNKDSADVPGDASPARKPTMPDVLHAMAQAQRSMADALLALSTGRAAGGGRKSHDVTHLPHSGVLVLGVNGELVFFEEGKAQGETLQSLADRGKDVVLSLELLPEDFTTEPPNAVSAAIVAALKAFLLSNANSGIATRAACGSGGPPPAPPTA